MIILVAAVILSLSSSDIVNKASEAKTKSDMANAKEAAATAYAEWMMMSETKKKDQYNDNFSEYVVDKLGDAGLPTSAVVYADLIGMKIGDYVAYTPATDDNGNVILLSEMPTTQKMLLERAIGYLEGPTKLNELCGDLYSNSTYGDARSINVEDVNRILGADPKPFYSNSPGQPIELPSPTTIGEIEKKDGIELAANKRHTPDNTDISNYKVDYYIYEGIKYKSNTTPEYKLIFVDGENLYYWLASPCFDADFLMGYDYFSLRTVDGGQVAAWEVFMSNDDDNLGYYEVRPVVTLKSNIKIGNKNGYGQWTLL